MDAIEKETQPCRRLDFDQDNTLADSCVDNETVESFHSKISRESIPRVGMEFESEDVAYEFYNAYALAVGFSVRRGIRHIYKKTVLDRTFVCLCEGKRGKDKRDDAYKSHRAETRFGCLAMLKISCRQACKYRVVNFVAEHNHNLASPTKAHLFRSHRKVSISQALEVDMADSSGIAPKNAYEFMARQAGGRENLGFCHVDYKNYLRSKSSVEMRSGDTGGVLEYLQRMKVEDPGFFYAIQVDEDDMITNIFWADATMIADYEDFGDVICFDTTYRKHKDGRPIALFVGVNHHRQTTIFGVALLYDETIGSFVWLFDTFLRAMGGNRPKTILTDQDMAMSSALASQWPQTHHRLCIWHIFQNAATHLSSVFSEYKEFARDFSNCIYEYDHEEDFLEGWSQMLEKYNLQNNTWLQRMFNIKEKWALVYGRDMFCADMITTQRSESMNRVIKQYISYKHDLRRFFEHFERLLNDRRYGEIVEDFKVDQSRVVLSFPVKVLKHAAGIYTPTVFTLFQEQLCKAHDCHLEIIGETGLVVKYLIRPSEKHHTYIVSYDRANETTCCTCKKFEFAGLLCGHILKVFTFRGIMEVPSKYILKRWTKDAKKATARAIGHGSNEGVDLKTAAGRRYRDLCRLSTRLFTKAVESEEGYIVVKDNLLNLLRNPDINSSQMLRDLHSNSTKRPEQSRLESCRLGTENDFGPNMPINSNAIAEKVKGIKSKQKSGSQSSKRPKGPLEAARRKKKKSQHIKLPDEDLQCPMSDQKEQYTMPLHPSYLPMQGDRIVQWAGSVSQESPYVIHPWESTQYNLSIPLEYSQLNMNANSQPVQTNLRFQPSQTSIYLQTEANTHFPYAKEHWGN